MKSEASKVKKLRITLLNNWIDRKGIVIVDELDEYDLLELIKLGEKRILRKLIKKFNESEVRSVLILSEEDYISYSKNIIIFFNNLVKECFGEVEL